MKTTEISPLTHDLSETTGTDSDAINQLVIEQVIAACKDVSLDPGLLTSAILDLLSELRPKTTMEGMLVAQMVATHIQGLKQMGQAAKYSQGKAANPLLDLSIRFQRLFVQQIDALERLQGKRHRNKTTVGPVHVHGGQCAVVGHMDKKG